MSTWIRRDFTAAGLTQSPPGPHFQALQDKLSGTVLLCIDVSGSMSGEPLRHAVSGGVAFLAEAEQAGYRCGLVLWHHGIEKYVAPDVPHAEVVAALRCANAGGGNELAPTLVRCKEVLAQRKGDRVVCVFGDGDVGNRDTARKLARELCLMGVRIVVRGLGRGAQEALAGLVCQGAEDGAQLIEDVAGIDAGIASMATGLIRRRG